ncbi:MAG TPA: hypothetical protein VLJ39_07660 [Tepidisphaeraceae bacterium]|nr:hypothetical protein [Tepidisphaeraceae bacterium]
MEGDDTLRSLRHSARGNLNSIKLCVSALELPCTPEEEMEFITDVISASDKLAHLMDDLDAYFDSAPADQVGRAG